MKFGSHFLDGPAAGVTLYLTRAPVLLRVVHSAHGGWDALDALEDRPKRTERVIVYRRASEVAWAFIDYSTPGGRRRGERIAIADYRILPVQPAGEHTRENEAWRKWCMSEAPFAGRNAPTGREGASCSRT